MDSFKTIASLTIFAICSVACVQSGYLGPIAAPLAAPAPVAYAKTVPYNVPPFAGSVSIFNKVLNYPVAPAIAPLSPFPQTPYPANYASAYGAALPAYAAHPVYHHTPLAPGILAPSAYSNGPIQFPRTPIIG